MSLFGIPKPCPADYVASNLPPHKRAEVRRLIEVIAHGSGTYWPLRMPEYLGGRHHVHGQLDPARHYHYPRDEEPSFDYARDRGVQGIIETEYEP